MLARPTLFMRIRRSARRPSKPCVRGVFVVPFARS